MAKSFEQIPNSILRIGLAAEEAFNSNQDFTLSLAFPSYGSALAFRKSFYSTRTFLRTLKQRRPNDILPYASALSGLERLSCARLDKGPAQSQLTSLGSVYLDFTLSATYSSPVDQQLSHLGLPDLPSGFNPFATPATALASASPSPQPTPSLPPSPTISLQPTSTSFHLGTYLCTVDDFYAPSAHENALRLANALSTASPSPTTQSLITLLRRKLLESNNISEGLRTHLATATASPTLPPTDC